MLKNSKHETVLAAFIQDPERVGWRAYRAVYPKCSQRAAETAWSRLLENAEFKARHDELLAAVTAEAKSAAVMDLTEVLEELSKLGRSNIQNVIVRGDDTADVVEALRDLPPEHAATIQELTIETYLEGGGEDAREVKRVRIKLHGKRDALSELRRHHEPDRHEHSGPDGKPIETKDASEPNDIARRVAFLLAQAAQTPAVPASKSVKRSKRK